MSIAIAQSSVRVPSTYQDWLACFDIMKNGSCADTEVFDAAGMGSFIGSELTKVALQNQIVETVNAYLDKCVKRFIRNLNTNIEFNELSQTELLFKRLKKDVAKSLFFTHLSFLPTNFRLELEDSVKKQMIKFWDSTIQFLYDQSLEFSNAELEDLLFLLKRIKLF